MDVWKVLVAAVLLASALGAGPVADAAELPQVIHKDVTLIAVPPKAGVTYDVGIVGANKAMTDIRKALDLLYRKSAFSVTAIQTLRKNGKIFIVYDPNFPEKGESLIENRIAGFRPGYFEKHGGGPGGKAFLALISRHGVKWPTPELAAVIAHELVGHAMQQLLGRFGFIRQLDLECEAWLYEERAYQDLGVDKFARDIVIFRQTLEYHYCSDFKRYMRQRDPTSAKLWDVLNPDVPRLLSIFDAYAKDLSAKGISGKAIKAAEKLNSEERLRWVAEKGSPDEQFGLGLAFRNGLGVPKDQGKAIKWFLLAAKNGLKPAQLEMAFIYDKGLGVTPSKAKAAKWFYHAAAQGEVYAQFTLAQRLVAGEGVRKDKAVAVKWYRRSAKQGFAIAQYHLARSYANGEGIKKNAAEALKWQRKAADQGFPLAQYRMANRFTKGDGVEKNEAQAVTWFRKAADQGLAVAQYNLAKRYLKGKGVKKNAVQAVQWYYKAAKQGDARSQNKLGTLYRKGEGVGKDDARGAAWTRKAAEQGLALAQYNLARILAKGQGVAKNAAKSLKWYRKSANAGYGRAQRNLAIVYEKGGSVRKDLARAYKWYALAAKKGVKGAAQWRDRVAKRMTPAQLSQAQELVRQWKPEKS